MSIGPEVQTEVVRGGPIRPHAGVSVPSDRLSRPTLTEEDRRGAPRVAALGANYLAQSFVRRSDDIRELRALTGSAALPIVAKIETRAAVDDFDDIARAADAVMIARGDLGVELPFEEVPIIQKQLVRRALDLGVPVIVATQMLESMVVAPRPTRAEASDVANAIFDGADAILLSAETAIGAHPVLAVEAAARIAAECDRRGSAYLSRRPQAHGRDRCRRAGLCRRRPCRRRGRRRRDRVLHAQRPNGPDPQLTAARVPILAFSPDPVVVAELALVHGVHARPCEAAADARLAFLSGHWRPSRGCPPAARWCWLPRPRLRARDRTSSRLRESCGPAPSRALRARFPRSTVPRLAERGEALVRRDQLRCRAPASTRALRLASVPEKIAPASHHSDEPPGKGVARKDLARRGSGSSARPGPIAR